MEFGVLGPVEVHDRGRLLPSGSGRERLVLATLLVNAERLTSTEVLVARLWGRPPDSAKAQLHNVISNLRRRFRGADASLIETRPAGYTLRLGPHRLDLATFRGLAERGRAAAATGDHTVAVALLDRALSLWRGPALADVADALAGELRATLHQERLAAAEIKLDAVLALGDYDAALHDVEPLVAENPYAERLYSRQMLALAGVGRRAEALAVYRRAHRRFFDDLGVEPGPALRTTQRQILRGDPLGTATATTVRTPPRQLPPAAPLTGRGQLLDRVGRELENTRENSAPVVLLVGPGGVGKSALAVSAGHGLSAVFSTGQLYADLRGSHDTPADPYRILERFLRALGVDSGQMPTDPEERVTLYRSHLAAGRTLVVLDDAGDEPQVRPLLPGAGGVVVTSRRQLGALLTAVRIEVPALPTEDAVRLLAKGAGAARVAAEPAAAREIVRLCGGLPLAVCIAAARLAPRPDATLDEFRGRLAAQRGRLDELAVGDLDVRASIALSCDALPADARRLLLRLGSFATADWPEWVAQVLVDVTPAQTRTLVDQLTDVHLVEPLGLDIVGQRRYRLHELVAEYARERHTSDEAPAERARALERALTGWLALAGEADALLGDPAGEYDEGVAPPPQSGVHAVRASPIDWFETERAGLVVAVDQASRSELPDIAGGLALRLSAFFWHRCYADDWEHVLHQAIACVRASGSDALLARLLDGLFKAHLHRDQYAQLPEIAAEHLAVAGRLGDPERHVVALRNSGLAALHAGRVGEAFDRLEQAVTQARGPAVPDGLLSDCLDTLGFARWEMGDAATAVPLLEEALAIDGAPGRSLRTALHGYHYGLALTDIGKLDDAERALGAALWTSQEVRDDLGTAYVEQAMADVDIRQGRWSDAAARLDRALVAHEKLGRPDGLAETLRALADLAAAEGRWAEALIPLRRALDIWRRTGSQPQIARVLDRLDRISAAAGDDAAAATYREERRSVLDSLRWM